MYIIVDIVYLYIQMILSYEVIVYSICTQRVVINAFDQTLSLRMSLLPAEYYKICVACEDS